MIEYWYYKEYKEGLEYLRMEKVKT